MTGVALPHTGILFACCGV